MSYVLAVTWVAKPGHEAEVKEILQTLGEASRQEPGVINYTAHVDPDDPRQFFIYEMYHDASGLEAHQRPTSKPPISRSSCCRKRYRCWKRVNAARSWRSSPDARSKRQVANVIDPGGGR
jgi:quinol monooxygenase YgiN